MRGGASWTSYHVFVFVMLSICEFSSLGIYANYYIEIAIEIITMLCMLIIQCCF